MADARVPNCCLISGLASCPAMPNAIGMHLWALEIDPKSGWLPGFPFGFLEGCAVGIWLQ